MSNRQDEIKDIVSQLQRLQIKESELLQRLEGLSEAESHDTAEPLATPTRDFRIGDLVQIKNPRSFQIKTGHIIRIGVNANRVTVQARNGSKVVRASFNLTLIEWLDLIHSITIGEDSKKPSPPGGGCCKKKWNKKKPTGAKPVVRPEKFQGGKDELDVNHFDCTGHGQSDRFVKTVQKIADYVGQEYKCGGISRTEAMTQGVVVIPAPTRPVGTRTTSADGVITTTPPHMLDVSDYQSAKKTVDYQILHQNENQQKIFSLVWQQCTEPKCMPRLERIVTIRLLSKR
jgi:hypothetical protein